MSERLSHGLPRLATDGNRIIRLDTGESVVLRGVNRSGLEYSEPGANGFLSAAGITLEEIRHITQDWGANIIRLPFNQDWALNGRGGRSPEEYLQSIDQVIDWAAGYGAYTLLDLQWLSAEDDFGLLADGSVNRIAPMPNELTHVLWRMLALRYREEPAVLFDLYNEPHAVSGDVWRMFAGALLGAIRELHPSAVIFVSGVDWGYDLRDVPLHESGVVYSTHVYPWKTLKWRKAFGWLADDRPVFAGEWGGKDEHLAWGGELCEYLRELGMGWTAWSWSDFPRLVHRRDTGDWTATRFGELVRRQLRIPLVLP